MTGLDKINMALIGSVATAIIWVYATFATAAEVEDVKVDIAYGQFYDRLDDYDEAIEEGNIRLAKEYAREMERLRAKICEADPEWERCDD